MDEITKLISNVGFPIACCFVLFKQNNQFSEILNKITCTLTNLNNQINDMKSESAKISDRLTEIEHVITK